MSATNEGLVMLSTRVLAREVRGPLAAVMGLAVAGQAAPAAAQDAGAPADAAVSADTAALPSGVEAMIRKAAESGDKAKIDAVADVATATYPDLAGQISALAASLKNEIEHQRMMALKGRDFYEGWKGSIEAGFNKTTGNTDETGTLFQLDTARDGIATLQRINALHDRQKADGNLTRSRSLATYQLNRKLGDRVSVYGLIGWEKDRFAGYTRRFTESFGVGYQLLRTDTMSLSVDAGPAFRQVRYVDGGSESEMAARGSVAYRWDVLPTLTFTQDASAILDGSKTFTSTTAFTTKLLGALSGRLSYYVIHEGDPIEDRKKTDTTMRLSLVYSY